MHQNARLADKKSKKKIPGRGHSQTPHPLRRGILPLQTMAPRFSRASALGVPIPFHLRLEHWPLRISAVHLFVVQLCVCQADAKMHT